MSHHIASPVAAAGVAATSAEQETEKRASVEAGSLTQQRAA